MQREWNWVSHVTDHRFLQKSVFVEKRMHPSCLVLQRLQENAGSDSDDIEIARLLVATTAMKNQTDCFYTAAVVFARRSARLYWNPSLQEPSLVRESDTIKPLHVFHCGEMQFPLRFAVKRPATRTAFWWETNFQHDACTALKRII